MTRPRIGYLSADDPFDRKSWSGTHYSILSHVQRYIGDVVVLGPFKPRAAVTAGKIIHKTTLLLTGRRYNYRHSSLLARAYARHFTKRILEEKPDIILAVSASCELSRVRTKVPVISVCDATVYSSKGYYRMLSGLSGWSLRESRRTEQLAMSKSAFVAFASTWARNATIKAIPHIADKSAVIAFGPNIAIGAEYPLERYPGTPLTLLFVGVSWERKGGPIAHECLLALIAAGIRAKLIVCGCVPPGEFAHPDMTVIPFLSKNDPRQLRELEALYRNADFLVLPTRSEALGVVFCEASAFGLPSLATDTGGVSDVVRPGVNGFLFKPEDRGHVYAQQIIDLLHDKEAYRALRRSSRGEYEERLNWENWTMQLKSHIIPLL